MCPLITGDLLSVTSAQAEAGRFFQVVDPEKGIKLRAAPCLEAEGTGHVLVPLAPRSGVFGFCFGKARGSDLGSF